MSNIFGRTNIVTGQAYSSDLIGTSNVISGYNTIVVGKENKVSLDAFNSNIFGRGNVAFDDELFIIGSGNTSSGFQSYIFGRSNQINNPGTCSYVLGGDNYNNSDNSTILGKANTLNDGSDNTVLVGYANTGVIGSNFSNVFGRVNYTTGTNTTLIGSGNYVSGLSAVVFGYANSVASTAIRTQVFGLGNAVSGADEVVVGSGNANSGINSMIVGYGNINNSSGTDANIFGRGNFSNANRASIYGSGNAITGNDSSTYGYNNQITESGTRTHIFGFGNISSGGNQTIVGSGNRNSGINSILVGYGNINTLTGTDANVFGRGNTSHATGLSIYGSGNHVSGAYSATYGYGNRISIDSTRTLTFGLENTSSTRNQTNVGSGNFNSGIDSWVIGYGNIIQTGTFNSIVGNNNITSAGLTGVSIVGDGITLPLNGNAGYKLNQNNMNGAMQIGVNNSGKITILENGNIAIGTSGTFPFENPQELLHVRSGNVLFDATEGGYFKFYDKNQYDNVPDNPSQRNQAGDIRAIVSGGNFKIDGDLILSTGIGETGQFLAGRIFQEAIVRNLDGTMWCYTPSDLQGNCSNLFNPYRNGTETVVGTDGGSYIHKTGLWQPTGLDLGWDTIGSPTLNYPSGYNYGYAATISVKDGAIAKPDFCNGDCNYDYQPHEIGRIGGLATTFLDGTPTSAIITGRYTFVNAPTMKTTNLYLPPVIQNSGVLYTVKNLGQGSIMVFATGTERIDLFFTGFMIEQRFASYEFLSNGSGWFLV